MRLVVGRHGEEILAAFREIRNRPGRRVADVQLHRVVAAGGSVMNRVARQCRTRHGVPRERHVAGMRAKRDQKQCSKNDESKVVRNEAIPLNEQGFLWHEKRVRMT
jgi:hypothetical protein